VLVTYVVARVDERWDAGTKVRLKADATYVSEAFVGSGFLTAEASATSVSRTYTVRPIAV